MHNQNEYTLWITYDFCCLVEADKTSPSCEFSAVKFTIIVGDMHPKTVISVIDISLAFGITIIDNVKDLTLVYNCTRAYSEAQTTPITSRVNLFKVA